MKRRHASLIAVLMAAVALGPGAPGAGRAAEFVVRPGGDTKVVFASKASIESFEGKTNKMEGRLTLDPSNPGDSITVHLEVDLASLDTGIAKRNEHMRENHLETAKYPKAVFDGAALRGPAGARLEPGKPTTFDVEGTFTLHGVSRRIRIQAEVTYRPGAGGTSGGGGMPGTKAGSGAGGSSGGRGGSGAGGSARGGTLAFKTEFPVALADYNISRPQFLFLKLADVQQVRVSAVATEAP